MSTRYYEPWPELSNDTSGALNEYYVVDILLDNDFLKIFIRIVLDSACNLKKYCFADSIRHNQQADCVIFMFDCIRDTG